MFSAKSANFIQIIQQFIRFFLFNFSTTQIIYNRLFLLFQLLNLAFNFGFRVFFRMKEGCSIIIYEIIFHNEIQPRRVLFPKLFTGELEKFTFSLFARKEQGLSQNEIIKNKNLLINNNGRAIPPEKQKKT